MGALAGWDAQAARGGGPRLAPPAPGRGRDAGGPWPRRVWLAALLIAGAVGAWAWAVPVAAWWPERAAAPTQQLPQLIALVLGLGGLATLHWGHVRTLVGGLTTPARGATTRRPATNGDRGRDVSGTTDATRVMPQSSAPSELDQTQAAMWAILDSIREIRDRQSALEELVKRSLQAQDRAAMGEKG